MEEQYKTFRQSIILFASYSINWVEENEDYFYVNVNCKVYEHFTDYHSLLSLGWTIFDGNTWRKNIYV